MALTKITPQMFDTSATAHDLNVDNGTFVVDGSASRVGIGTPTPGALLHVNGAAIATTISSQGGSATTPGISFVGDTNTGIYSSPVANPGVTTTQDDAGTFYYWNESNYQADNNTGWGLTTK